MKDRSEFPLLEEYFDFLSLKRVKRTTINTYRGQMVKVLRTMQSLGIDPDPRTMDASDGYRALFTMDLCESSREAYSFQLKAFCRHFGNGGMDGLKILTDGNRPNVRWISDEQLSILMDTPDIRHKLMIHLGGNYGLRRGEIAALKLRDLRDGYMIVHGKGHSEEGKVREVPLAGGSDAILDQYLRHRRRMTEGKQDLSDGSLFYYIDGGCIYPLSPSAVGDCIKRCMTLNGIDATSHSLRREFITSAHHAGCDIIDIMNFVGHSSPAVTVSYIRRDIERMRSVVESRNQYISGKQSRIEEDEMGSVF